MVICSFHYRSLTNTKEQWHDWGHIFVNGTGILNTWKWPDIKGLHDFKGPLMHSPKWDHTVDFDNKTVGVIGTGSSSVQIVHQLQKICKEVQVFKLRPTWISPPFDLVSTWCHVMISFSSQAMQESLHGAHQRYKIRTNRVRLESTDSP